MDAPMTMDELAARMPLQRFISITDAAQILGGGKTRISGLMDLVMNGELKCRSHILTKPVPPADSFGEIISRGLFFTPRENPSLLTPNTDPSTVLVMSDDITGRWCLDLEKLLIDTEDINNGKQVSEDRLRARLTALKARAYELKIGTCPAPVVEQEPTAPAEKPRSTKADNTLLKMVIGMAIAAYKYDPAAKKSDVPGEIASDLAGLGIDVTAETVRNHLRVAVQTVLPPQS